MSGIFTSFKISSSGLSAQRRRMDAVASNIANAETTRSEDGSFYRRKRVHLSSDKNLMVFDEVLRQSSIKCARTNPVHLKSIDPRQGRNVNLTMVKSNETRDPETKYKLVYDPSHPDADEKGYVKMPDINMIGEMVDMMVASRAYEANTAAIEAAKNMARKALNI
ncbi:MAG: flagellar basal body rod protein FlgC [candidate division Zixibacteria bacterium]|nr:flagellar basal body rod protein FlgC [candidate division Zixibacteria bacterium]